MFTRHYPHWPPGLPKHSQAPRRSVWKNLEERAARHPQRPAIDYYGTRITYGELARCAEALAGHLQSQLGVGKGDRVLLCLQNSPQFVMAYYAILRADAVVVPINPMYRTGELREYVRDAELSIAVVGEDVLGELAPLADERAISRAVVARYADYLREPTDLPLPALFKDPRPTLPGWACAWKEALEAGCMPRPHGAQPDDLAVLPYTSGTTGRPKGCMHTHASVQATISGYMKWRGSPEEGVVLSALPLYHVTGMQAGMNAPLNDGCLVVLLSRWDRRCAALQIERARVTTWSAITTMLVDFLSDPQLERAALSSLRALGGGGAAMPEALARRLEQLIGLPYVEGYGLTETMAPSHINPPQRPKPQCAGIPIFATDARILGLGDRCEKGPRETGEIVVHGPQVFHGYWRQPEATADAFVEIEGKRFFRTGDLGYYDEDGYFFVTDRLKRMINASGLKVWPAEVESLLYGHPEVLEACVVGTRDPYRGETVKAFVVPKESARGRLTPEAIVDWSRARMAAFKVPRVVEIVDALPKTATGKILWRKLQDEENERTR